jgi:hypothetical protein
MVYSTIDISGISRASESAQSGCLMRLNGGTLQ